MVSCPPPCTCHGVLSTPMYLSWCPVHPLDLEVGLLSEPSQGSMRYVCALDEDNVQDKSPYYRGATTHTQFQPET